MVEASGAAGAFVCGGAIEGSAVGLVLRLSRFAGGLPDFAFAIVALAWAVVTFSPPAARSIISSRALGDNPSLVFHDGGSAVHDKIGKAAQGAR